LNRAFNFSSQSIIERLSNEFIPYTGDTAELQFEFGYARYEVADWFRKMAADSGWKKEGNTAQGLYVAGADGTCYGRKKTLSVAATHRFLNACLEGFKKKPPAPAVITDAELKAPFTRPAAKSTSVIRVYSRIRPLPEGADNRNANVGRDHLWIYPEDLKSLLAADETASEPEEAEKARKEFVLPEALVARVIRFALCDMIRGEADFWKPTEVTLVDFKALRVEPAKPEPFADAAPVAKGETPEPKPEQKLHAFRFHGRFGQTTLLKKGLDGAIQGEIEFDEATMKVTRFRAYAKGEAWGSSTWSNRGTPKGKFPIVFALIEAVESDKIAHEVPPAAVARNADYKFPALLPKRPAKP